MKRAILGVALAIAAFVHHDPVAGYDLETHASVSAVAVTQSVLTDPTTLANLGLRSSVVDSNQTFPNSEGVRHSVIELIRDGARFEDNNVRPAWHFFNPRTGLGLYGMTASPDWALEDKNTYGLLQDNSYRHARQQFFRALTETNNFGRPFYFGLVFQSLGQVIHHLQDMAQPQHVRDDSHLSLTPWQLGIACGVVIFSPALCTTLLANLNPSAYESYIESFQAYRFVDLAAYPATYSPSDTTTFSMPRAFWLLTTPDNRQVGIAEYTNRNFVSDGTNFSGSPGTIVNNQAFPTPSGATAVINTFTGLQLRAMQGCPGVLPPAVSDTDQIIFVSTTVADAYTNQSTDQFFTSTYSIFDPDLESHGKNMVFSLNRFNFCAAQAYLLPRAVGYSAGLINYFFRGQMAIQAPDEGVYAIIDHTSDDITAAGCGTPCGFRKAKLKVKNTTPTDDMANGAATMGSLIVVAKFHLNNCYKPDLSGEYGGSGYIGASCRSTDESIVVSNPVPVLSVDRTFSAQPLTFTFPDASPIPINATDLYLQVVYQGKLGQETGAVAVTTIDLHEPTYLTFGNHNDFQAGYDSQGRFAQIQSYQQAGPFSLNLQLRFAPPPQSASQPILVASSARLDPGAYHRLAILSDQPAVKYTLIAQYLGGLADEPEPVPDGDEELQTLNLSLTTSVHQADAQGNMTDFPPFVKLRRTAAVGWSYESDIDGGAVYWVPSAFCIPGASNCTPQDKTVGAIVRNYPPFAQPTPTPMTISF